MALSRESLCSASELFDGNEMRYPLFQLRVCVAAFDQVHELVFKGVAQVPDSIDVNDLLKHIPTGNLCTLNDHVVGRAEGGNGRRDVGYRQFSKLRRAT